MKNKKIYSIATALLVCVLLFAGCTKADDASLFDCTQKYEEVVSKYYVADESFVSAEISNKDRYIFAGTYNEDKKIINYSIDLYSQKAYNQPIFVEIEKDDGASQKMNFGLLKKGNEYETLASISLQYFEKRKTEIDDTILDILSHNGIDVPQQEYSQLYVSMEDFEADCKTLANKKTNLVTSCNNIVSQSSAVVVTNFESFIKAYNDLIGRALEISQIYQHIDSNYFNLVSEDTTIIPDGELTRLVDGAILYCASAYYVKYMKNAITSQIAFGHEGVNQDSNFASFKTDIVDRYSGSISDVSSDSDELFQYQIAKKKLNAVIDDFDKYDDATAKIAKYLKDNNLEQIDTTREDYFEVSQYCQFALLYEQNIANLQGIIISYVAKG